MTGAQQRRCQFICWQRASDRPYPFEWIALGDHRVRGEDSGDPGPEVIQLPQPADGLLDGSDAVAWEVAVVGSGVQLCGYDQLLPPAMTCFNGMHLHPGKVRGCRFGLAQRTDARH